MSKTSIEHKEPVILGFFILQYAKLTMLQLKYYFFTSFCKANKYELIEMDTDSLHMALSEEKLDEILRPEMQPLWYRMRVSNCSEFLATSSSGIFFPRDCCNKHAAFDKRTPGLFNDEFRCSEMIAFVLQNCCYDEQSDTKKLSSKGINKNNGEEPLAKYRKNLFDEERVYSTKVLRTRQSDSMHVLTQKMVLSYFYTKPEVCEDGIHTTPLDM